MSDTPKDHECCTCGYKWLHGLSGSHDCAYHMAVTIRKMQSERDKLKAINAELVESMLPLLSCLPLATCADFHHRKEDRHGYNEHCPVRRRYESGIEKCKSAITKAREAK